jgi:hypothetical protein
LFAVLGSTEAGTDLLYAAVESAWHDNDIGPLRRLVVVEQEKVRADLEAISAVNVGE